MAEYYPLLFRAVAALPDSTPESRRKIYERARQALIGQLRKINPPIPEADIESESRALDVAVAKLEAELKAKADVADAVRRSAAAPPLSTRPPEVKMAPAARKPAPPMRPFVPPRSPPPDFSANAPENVPKRSSGPAIPPPVAPVKREPARAPEVKREPGRAPDLPPPVRTQVQKAAPEAAELSAWRPTEPPLAEKDQEDDWQGGGVEEPVPSQPKAGWRGFGRPRRDTDAKPAKPGKAVIPKDAAGDVATFGSGTAKSSQGRVESLRPAAPQAAAPRRRLSRHWIVGSIVALVVIAIAALAIFLKDNPDDLARRAHLAAPPPDNGQTSGKIADRVGGPSAQPAAAGASAPAPGQTQQASAAAQQPNGGSVIAVAQRAALLVQSTDQQQSVKTYVGTVVWRRENVNRGQDQALSIAVRADIDVPEAKLKATVIFQKNTDATLPASHTIEVRFMPADGSSIPGVKQIEVPQLRVQDTPQGDPLTGVPAPITQNYFLVGLTQGDAAVARNIDLIKSRQWIDISMLLTDNRIAKLTFEKGDPGDRAINDALASWQ